MRAPTRERVSRYVMIQPVKGEGCVLGVDVDVEHGAYQHRIVSIKDRIHAQVVAHSCPRWTIPPDSVSEASIVIPHRA